MRALVTGATGLVGSHLVRKLLDRRIDVRILAREGSDLSSLEGLPLERASGDIRDREAVRRAVEGCDWVFHNAAVVTAWEKRREEVWAVNVGGTEHVVGACVAAGVKRLVHTSSAAAVGFSRDAAGTLDEDSNYNFVGLNFLYQDSKRTSEEVVLAAARRGLPAVVCNPPLIFGAWDKDLHSAKLLRMARRGALILYPAGGVGVVWADDVATGLVRAAERGRVGQRYILNGENLPYRDLFREIRKVAGGPGTWVPIPERALTLAGQVSERFSSLTGGEPAMTPSRAFVMSSYQYLNDHKARIELDYEPHLAIDALKATAEWMTARNLW